MQAERARQLLDALTKESARLSAYPFKAPLAQARAVGKSELESIFRDPHADLAMPQHQR